jgi:hypothetical protein
LKSVIINFSPVSVSAAGQSAVMLTHAIQTIHDEEKQRDKNDNQNHHIE